MKVLLLQDTKNLGKKYEIVTVNDGFAQNNLFPKKIALPAKSAEALKIINDKEKNTTKKNEEEDNFWKSIKNLNELKIKKATDKSGHFYSKVNEKDILEEIEKHNFKIPPKLKIVFKSEIKQTGNYEILMRDNLNKKEHSVNLEAESE